MNRIDQPFGIPLHRQYAHCLRAQHLDRSFEGSERTINRGTAALNERGVPSISLLNVGDELLQDSHCCRSFFAADEAGTLVLAGQLSRA